MRYCAFDESSLSIERINPFKPIAPQKKCQSEYLMAKYDFDSIYIRIVTTNSTKISSHALFQNGMIT